MKMFILVLLAMGSSPAFAGDSNKIRCVFETKLNNQSASAYIVHYDVNGTISSLEGMLSIKRTEYGVVKLGGKYVVDRSNVKNESITDVPYRKFLISPKNTSSEWKTFTPKTPVNDGYIVHASVTIANGLISEGGYGKSHKAILSMTTQTDEAPYTEKTLGICSVAKE